MNYHHVPVLLNEVIQYLKPQPGENFVDATLGGGGYSKAILQQILPEGKLLAIDLDKEATKNFQVLTYNTQGNEKLKIKNKKSVIVHHGNFRDLDKIVRIHNFTNISGIVADLGFSSHQLDRRGISFQQKEILDMRFDISGSREDAKFILNYYDQNRLEQIFREFGEEKYFKQIAKKIIEYRTESKIIKFTTELFQIIEAALPKPVRYKAHDSARRIFQALRIVVNHELENLEIFLPKAFNLLKSSGRLAIVSFHSLEDRMVKRFFLNVSKGCVCPPEFPACICGKEPKGRIITKKPILASELEIKTNPRSKPAKLRVLEKI